MTENQTTGLNIYRLVWRRKKFIISTVFIASLIAVVISLFLPKWYKASAVILPPSGEQSPFGALGMLGELGVGNLLGGSDNQFRYISILKSRSLREKVVDKFNLQTKYKCNNVEETLLKLKKNMDIAVGDEMQIAVKVLDKDQDLVAEMANYIVFCLDSMNIAMTSGKAKNVRKFIENRMDEVIDSLILLEAEIIDFMKSEGILSIEEQISVSVMNATELKFQIITKEIELAITQKNFEKNNPKVKMIENEVEILDKKYSEYFGKNSDDNLYLNFSEIPQIGLKMKRLEREAEYLTNVLKFLGPQYEQAKIEETKKIPTLQVLDKAIRPEIKSKPKRSLIVLLSAFVAGLISTSIVIAKEK